MIVVERVSKTYADGQPPALDNVSLQIADGSIFGAQTGVSSHIKEAGQIWQGYPAMPVATFRRLSVIQKQLPDLQRKIYDLERQIEAMKTK